MITLDPPASGWQTLLDASPSWKDGKLVGDAHRAREQAGLPTDRPLIMTGHQPTFWHPGILAKFLACEHASEALGAHCAWIVPDQDEVDPLHIRVPVYDADDTLVVRQCAMGEVPLRGASSASLPASEITKLPGYSTLDSVSEGLHRIHALLASHASEPSLARQAQASVSELLEEHVEAAPILFASEFHTLDVFGEMLHRMECEPEKMTSAYNNAVRANPDAGISPLIANEVNDKWELPLWRTGPSEPRRRVYAEQVEGLPGESLVPRALSMTAIARAHLCDLFIHGTGGGQYDRLTEQWMRDWMGIELASAVVTTATLTLPLRDEHPTDEQVKDAIDLAHRAQHNPALLGDDTRASAKEVLLSRISEAKLSGSDPSELFHELQTLLRDYRDFHAQRLAELQAHASLLRKRLEERSVVEDRTWAFPLFGREQLSELGACIAHQFEAIRVRA